MTMLQFGLSGYKAAIDENIALAHYLADCVRQSPDLALMAPPSLSVVCFRYVGTPKGDRADGGTGRGERLPPRDRSEDDIAALNRALLERLQLGGEAFLTSTDLRGRFVLRACIVNFRSRREDVDRMLAAVRATGKELENR
jgi:aromatic-L-amino-acid/L-tryptophan decarboxylase